MKHQRCRLRVFCLMQTTLRSLVWTAVMNNSFPSMLVYFQSQ